MHIFFLILIFAALIITINALTRKGRKKAAFEDEVKHRMALEEEVERRKSKRPTAK